MRSAWPLALVLGAAVAAAPARAQQDPWGEDEDPFAAFEDEWDDPWAGRGGLAWTGFVEGALGSRWASVDDLDRMTLGELRGRAETRYDHGSFRVDFKGDLNWDAVVEELDARVRELALSFSPGANVDLKLGRQVLTWGTGDLLFLNDLFPKDFVSFFAGRDEDYLKSPSDTARIRVYTAPFNVDFAWTPRFTPDDYLYGERFAFWNPQLGEVAAPAEPRKADEPGGGEFALRLFRTVAATEYAVYGYRGRWKQPLGVGATGELVFPRLNAWGASVRTPLHKGIFNTEFAWYDSREDRRGDDPRVPNSELRLLVGYEQELVRNLTMGTQLYTERLLDYGELLANSPDADRERDKWRTVATLRLSYRALQDRLTSSLFVFVSPSDADYYLRPSIAWRRDDQWLFTAGFNLLGGRDEHTFFGQLEDNSNGWIRVRYHY
jgi:hypothetical protein